MSLLVSAVAHLDAPGFSEVRPLQSSELLWWMGSFALVLDRVERVPFVPCHGALGFWRVPADVAERAGFTGVVDPRALSLLQPWLDAVLDGGKPLENRVKWTNSNFRGPVLLHASKRGPATLAAYAAVTKFVVDREIAWRPRAYDELQCGGILGRANVVGVVRPRTSEATGTTRATRPTTGGA